MKKSTLLYAFIVFLFVSSNSNCASFYWVGGTGDWSDLNHWSSTSGGAPNMITLPAINDNVFFDVNSFTAPGQIVTVDTSSVAVSKLDFTGALFNPELTGGVVWLSVRNELQLIPGMVWGSTVQLAAGTSLGTCLIKTAGVVLPVFFSSAYGGAVELGDDLNCSGTINVTSGIFRTNGYNINCREFNLSEGLPGIPEIYLGESTITTTFFNNTSGFTPGSHIPVLDADSATIIIDDSLNNGFFYNWKPHALFHSVICKSKTTLGGDSVRIQNLEIQNDARMPAIFLIDTLSLNNGGFNTEAGVINLMGTIVTSSSGANPAKLTGYNGGYIYKASGVVCIDSVILEDMVTSGSAFFYAGTGSNDLGGNTGWMFSPCNSAPSAYYWVGNSGNWSDYQNHWASVSGGTPDKLSAPGSADTVYFNANSFTSSAQVVNFDTSSCIAGRIICNGILFPPTFTGSTITVTHALELEPGITWDAALKLNTAAAPSETVTVHTAGVTIGNFDVAGTNSGDVVLDDALTVANNINLYNGRFKTSGVAVATKMFVIRPPLTSLSIDYGTSTITTTSYVDHNVDSVLDLSAMQSTIVIDNPLNNGFFSLSSSRTAYGRVIIKCNTTLVIDTASIHYLEIQKNANFPYVNNAFKYVIIDSLVLNNPGSTLLLKYIIEIKDALISYGVAGNPVTINGDIPPVSSNGGFYKADGIVCMDYLNLIDVRNFGGATFYAGLHSTATGDTIGWTFDTCGASPAGYYWVGNSGNWSDVNHWATTSGGSVHPAAIPFWDSDIYIDENSFTLPGQTILIDTLTHGRNFIVHPDVPFTITKAPAWTQPFLEIYGSLDLSSNLLWDSALALVQIPQGASTVKTGGCMLPWLTQFYGRTELMDDIHSRGLLQFFNFWPGTSLKTNDNDLYANAIDFGQGNYLGTSHIYTNSARLTYDPRYSDYTNSTFTILGTDSANLVFDGIDTAEFGTIYFNGDAMNEGYGPCKVRRMVINDNLSTNSEFIIDTLVLNNPGGTLTLDTNSTLTINSLLVSNGTSSSHVTLKSDGGTATLIKANGDVCLHDVDLQNIVATGGAQFYADTSCTDLGGNTGWQFGPCSVTSYVWPGDADYDGTVSNFDVLNIGLAFNEMGPVRAGASLAYVAQPAVDWISNFVSGVNKKHADCNGDGIIDGTDRTAIYLNYGVSHPLRSSTVPGGPELYIMVNDSANLGDTVTIDFYLGTASDPANDIYGIAFSLNFNDNIADSTYFVYDYTNSWLGDTTTNLLTFQQPFLKQGRIDFALTRTDHQNVSGSGYIGSCGIVIVDNIGAKLSVPFYLSNVLALNASEEYVPVSLMSDTLSITSVKDIDLPTANIYPNPASDKVRISSQEFIKSIEILNLSGNIISAVTVNGFNPQLTISLNSGFYLVRLITDKGVICKKLNVNNPE